MRITLVHPAGSNWMPGRTDITATANRMAPLGLLSIAAYLKRGGHRVAIHDCLGPQAPRRLATRGRARALTGPDVTIGNKPSTADAARTFPQHPQMLDPQPSACHLHWADSREQRWVILGER